MGDESKSPGGARRKIKPMDITKPAQRTKKSSTWARAGVFWRIIGLTAAIGLVGIAILLVALLAPPFEGLRHDLAERLLEFQVGKDVQFKGTLEISVARDIRVAFTDLVVKNPDWASEPDMARVKRGEISLRLWPLFTGALVVPQFVVDGAALNFEIAADGRKSWLDAGSEADEADGWSTLPLFGVVSVKNSTIDWLDKSVGFDVDLALENLETKRGQDGSANLVDGSGQLNGTQFSVTGRMPALDSTLSSDNSHAVQLALSTSSFSISADGKIENPRRGEGVDVAVTTKVSSLGDFLDTFEIERAWEGKGDLVARISGDVNLLSLTGLQTDIVTDTGDTVRFSGSIADIWSGTGIDIEFASKLAFVQASAGNDSLFDGFRLTGLSGKVTGDLEALRIPEMHVKTNAYARAFQDIGPITVERFRKDEKNQLQLLGINAVVGLPDKPKLQLRGSIGDLLTLQDLSLSGTFDVDTAPALGFEAEEAKSKLGILHGVFKISDADGSAGFEQLDAEVTASDIISLKITSVLDDLAQGDGLKFDVSLKVPKYSALAEAVGEQPYDIGAIEFEGSLAGSDEQVRVRGKGRVGQTNLSGDLTGTLKGKRPFLQGELSTPKLRWSDLRALALPARVSATPASSSAQSNTSSARRPELEAVAAAFSLDAIDLDLNVKAAKIDGGGTQVSNVAGHIKLVDGVLTLDPLKVIYLGGNTRLNGTFDSRKPPSKLKIKGRVDDWQIGRVLKQLGASAPISGEMYATFDLSAAGDTARALWGSLNGKFSMAVSRGRIESSIIALTGLDLSAYLFSHAATRGYTQVDCFIGRFQLNKGVATATTLLLDTPDIQMIGKGSINLSNDTIDIGVQPHPKRHQLIELGTPFTITGPLSDPKLTTHGTGLRAVGEAVLLGQNLLGTLVHLVTDNGKDSSNPCLGRQAR